MNNVQVNHDKFIKAVGAKVQAAMADIKKSGNRDERGFQFSATRIVQSAENLFFMYGGANSKYNDPVQAIYQGFSERPGLANTGNIAGVDVVDINIAATNQSVLGYLSAERGLDKPIDTLWFQGLKALADGNGFSKNQWVNRPYMPMNKAIRRAIKGAMAEVVNGTEAGKVDFSKGVALADLVGKDGEVLLDTLQVLDGNKVIGKCVDGEIYFNNGTTSAEFENGVITFKNAPAGAKLVVGIDRTTEKDGKNTIKLKPATETIQVSAQPRRIHLEQSYEDLKFQPKKAKSSYK